MPRFAVLCHHSPRGQHWDLLLQWGKSLRTWALPKPPASGVMMMCTQLPDHRLEYLDYEGEISGGRGSVSHWDGGTYELESDEEGRWMVRLQGTVLHGRAVLERVPQVDTPEAWRFVLMGE